MSVYFLEGVNVVGTAKTQTKTRPEAFLNFSYLAALKAELMRFQMKTKKCRCTFVTIPAHANYSICLCRVYLKPLTLQSGLSWSSGLWKRKNVILHELELQLWNSVCSRYKRKGSSSLGLDLRRQGVSWEESESNKKQKGRDKRKAADRYFSAVSRQLLRSQLALPTLPKTPDCHDVISAITFLPLGDHEGENNGGQTGTRFTQNWANIFCVRPTLHIPYNDHVILTHTINFNPIMFQCSWPSADIIS